MRLTSIAAFVFAVTLAGILPAAGQPASTLERPDPGIGEGFATMLAEQFMDSFGVDRAEADCLVYEAMTELRASGDYSGTPQSTALLVAHRCQLKLQ